MGTLHLDSAGKIRLETGSTRPLRHLMAPRGRYFSSGAYAASREQSQGTVTHCRQQCPMQYAQEVTPPAVRSFAFSKATKRNSLRTAAAENEQSEITGLSSASVQKGRMHGSLPNSKLQADRGSADGNNQPKKCRPAGDGGQLGSMYLSSGTVDVGL